MWLDTWNAVNPDFDSFGAEFVEQGDLLRVENLHLFNESNLYTPSTFLAFWGSDSGGWYTNENHTEGNFLTFTCVDSEDAHSPEEKISFEVSCPSGLVVNVWSSGELCLECPEGAECSESGQFEPIAAAGYYQSGSSSAMEFIECYPPEACTTASLGGDASCALGYSGERCAFCQDGFTRESELCVECTDYKRVEQMFSLILFLAALFIFSILLTFNFLKVGQAIVITYMQTLGFIATLALEWSITAQDLSILFQVTNGDVTVDCIFHEVDTDYISQWKLFVCLPLIIAAFGLLPLLSYQLYHKCAHSITDLRHLYWNHCVGFLSFVYLPITAKALEIFRCQTLGDYEILLAQPSLFCTDDWHAELVPIAILMALLYGVGIPFLLIFYEFRNRPIDKITFMWHGLHLPKHPLRKDLEYVPNAAVRKWMLQYNIITANYSPDSYFWSIVVMFRNMTLVCVTTALSNEPITQAFFLLIVIGGFLGLHLTKRPYRNITLNRMETITLFATWWIVFCGILYSAQANLTSNATMNTLLFLSFFAVAIGSFLWIFKLMRNEWRIHHSESWCGKCCKTKQIIEFQESPLHIPFQTTHHIDGITKSNKKKKFKNGRKSAWEEKFGDAAPRVASTEEKFEDYESTRRLTRMRSR